MTLRRFYFPALILLLALLACTSTGLEGGGHVTPIGTILPTETFGPLDTPPAPPTPTATPNWNFTPSAPLVPGESLVYRVQTGDTLALLAQRFNVPVEDLLRINQIPSPTESLVLDEILFIPARLEGTGPDFKIIPDSELVYSPNAAGFNVAAFVNSKGGYLARHRESVRERSLSGGEIVQQVALDHSVNPRILLAVLQYQSSWVTDPTTPDDKIFPLGYRNPARQGLFQQLDWLADTLNLGYYRWRDNKLTALDFPDGGQQRINPALNAGTAAVQFLYSRWYSSPAWEQAVGTDGVYATYSALFGDPFEKTYEPLIPNDLTQPELGLPFMAGRVWTYISGPHAAWEPGSPWAALDFAPPSSEVGCLPSLEWVAAPAPGVVVRSADGVVVIDLDGDGREQSGWAIMFLHIASEGRIPAGRTVEAGDPLGHPSCEGGRSTGTHFHIARKYNGEWIAADGDETSVSSIPFNLGGWIAHAGPREYKGTMTKGTDSIIACQCSAQESGISTSR
jgi:LysM repeat protein